MLNLTTNLLINWNVSQESMLVSVDCSSIPLFEMCSTLSQGPALGESFLLILPFFRFPFFFFLGFADFFPWNDLNTGEQ